MEKYIIAPPAGSQTNAIGAKDRPWEEVHAKRYPGLNEYLAESTGYGIVSGCEPSISGLTVKVGAGVIHLADGTRKEIVQTNITLDNADPTNPRIDLVYIDSTGAVAKITGTAAASPSVPTLPTDGISVCNVTIAAGATTGAVTDSRDFALSTNKNVMTVKEGHFEKLVANEILTKGERKQTFDKSLGILLHVQNWNDNQLNVILSSPFSVIRTSPLWQSVETAAGVYDFSAVLNVARKIQAHEKKGSWIMSFSNPLYTSAVRSGINSESARIAFKNYCVAWANELVTNGITGSLYEIYNEPNNGGFWSEYPSISAENYTELVKAVYPAIKAVDPTCKIITHNIMNGLYLSGMKWIKCTIDNGILDYTDGISIHPYSPDAPETMSQAYLKLHNIISNASSRNIPIYVMEVGYSACPNYDGTGLNAIAPEPLRKKYIPRLLLNNIKYGIPVTALYMAFNLTDDLTVSDSEKLFGIYLQNGESTDTSNAINNIYSLLNNAKYEGVIYESKNANILKFICADGSFKYVGWCYGVNNEQVKIFDKSITLTDTPTEIDLNDNIYDYDTFIPTTYSYDISHSSVVSKLTMSYRESYSVDDIPASIDGDCCAVFGKGTKTIGSHAAAAGYYNVAGVNCVAAGNQNIAISGTISAITNINDDIITVVSSDGLFTGQIVAAVGDWKKPLVCKILAINSNNLQLDRKLPTGYDKIVYRKGNNYSSIAFGAANLSYGYGSLAIGTGNKVHGDGALAAGAYNEIDSNGCFACGGYCKQVGTTDTLIVGNGTSSVKSNAFRVTRDGAVYGLSAYNSSGADYAEYFEWKDGNTDNDDRVGYFVTLDNDKIRIAKSTDSYILGIVSGNASVIGNSYNDQWQNMYVTDDFGRIQYEDVEVADFTDGDGNIIIPAHTEKRMKINPDYDNTQKYIGRENRKEWSAVGMLGVLPVRDDGTCEVNGYCKVADGGIAAKANSGYRVVARVADNIIKVLFR